MNKGLYNNLAKMIPLFRCEMWPKCTLKMEGKRAENIAFFSLFESTHHPNFCLVFLFFQPHKKQFAAPFDFRFSAFSSFFSV